MRTAFRQKALAPSGLSATFPPCRKANLSSNRWQTKTQQTKHPMINTIPYKNTTLGATSLIQVPATLEDLVASSNAINVHHAAIKHSLYQGWNTKFRKAFVKFLVEHTGIAIPSTGKKRKNRAGDEIDILISENDYIKFLLAEKHIEESDYIVFHQQVTDTVPFECSKKEEEAEPDAKFFSLAKKILGMVEAGSIGSDGNPVTEEGFVAKWSASNPGYNFDNLGGFTEEGIARALEIDERRRSMELPVGLV